LDSTVGAAAVGGAGNTAIALSHWSPRLRTRHNRIIHQSDLHLRKHQDFPLFIPVGGQPPGKVFPDGEIETPFMAKKLALDCLDKIKICMYITAYFTANQARLHGINPISSAKL
jgi:hypothetical protein